MSIEKELTPKQMIFCKEYLIDMNATRAIIEAGYSKKSADTQGSRMLRNVKVKTYIDEMMKKRAERLDITADNVLKEISHTAFFDIRKIFDNNVIKETDQLDDNTAKALGSIKVRREKQGNGNYDEVIEVKSNDKLKALDMLARHLGLYATDNEQTKPEHTAPIINIIEDKHE